LADLREVEQILEDDVYRFRLSGERRLWGLRRQDTFYAIWWDPKHQVYPTEPE
jgi:hypothetical protein